MTDNPFLARRQQEQVQPAQNQESNPFLERRGSSPSTPMGVQNLPSTQGQELRQNLDSSMYDGMGLQESQELYERLGPIYIDEKTNTSYIVPKPSVDVLSTTGNIAENAWNFIQGKSVPDRPTFEATADPIQKGMGIASNAVRNAVSLPLAIRDKLSGTTGAEEFLEDTAIYPTQGLEKTVEEIAPMVVGGMGGASAAYKLMPKVIKESSKVSAWAAKALATNTGASAGASLFSPNDSETFLVGDNSFTGILEGIDFENDTRADEILESRMNVFLDAMIMGGVIDAGAKTAGAAIGLLNTIAFKPLLNMGSTGDREKAIVSNIVDQFAIITGKESKEDRYKLALEISESIRDNKEVFIELSQSGLDDISIPRDTMSALEEAMKKNDTEEARRIVIRARELKKDALSKGGTEMEMAASSPDRELTRFNQNIRQQEGLDEEGLMLQGMEEIQDLGRVRVNEARAMVDNTEQALLDESSKVQELLKEDPMFGEIMKRASDDVGFDFNRLSDESLDKVKVAFEDLHNTMNTKKNDLYNKIPDNVLVDEDLLSEIVEEGKGVFDSKTLKIIEDSKGDFKTLYNRLTPHLRDVSNKLYRSNSLDFDAIDSVDRLRDFINNDAFDFIIEGSDQEVADAVLAARSYYSDEYAPLWKDGALTKIKAGIDLKPTKPVEGSRVQRMSTETGLSPNEPEYATQLIEAMKREEYQGSPSDMTDYIIGRTASRILESSQDGKALDELSMGSITGDLSKYGRTLRENFPQESERIDSFVKEIQSKRGDIKSMRNRLEELKVKSSNAEKEIYGGYLKDFFTKEGLSFKPNENAQESFRRLLSDKEGFRRLKEVAADVPSGSVAHTALKRAYNDYLDNALRTSQENLAGSKSLKTQKVQEALSGRDQIFEMGDFIYKDRPEIPYIQRRLLGLSHENAMAARAKGASGNLNMEGTEFVKNARGAVDFIVTQTLGVLNRTAAVVRSGASKILVKLDPQDQARYVLDKLYADPDEFLRVLDTLIEEQALSTNVDKSGEIVFDFLVKSGIYGTEDKDVVLEETKTLLGDPTFSPDTLMDELQQ